MLLRKLQRTARIWIHVRAASHHKHRNRSRMFRFNFLLRESGVVAADLI